MASESSQCGIFRTRSHSEPARRLPKGERFVWSGFSTTFQDKEFQQRTREKIDQLIGEVATESNQTNARIALKVLKYRKLSVHAATRCV
ncbi:hypothetical protein P3T76_011935 [Phytophthora citrophthora]|uniref:Uncharacterized protein n=1 Tax=Phytophthora citrophthora TaxID=4793 RepID=A0AAD9G8E9_9STRA|nr:hypothetical protein P3T76_011935 [Phytophthora citrophthora]